MKKISEEEFYRMVSSYNSRPRSYKNKILYPYIYTFTNMVHKFIDVYKEITKGKSVHIETYYVDENLLPPAYKN